jgi:colicin import membrane protein
MLGAQVPSPQAVREAASFLDVIKLAASKDVQQTIARMEELSSEAKAQAEIAQNSVVEIAEQRSALAKESADLDIKRQALEGDLAAAKRASDDAAADRASAAKALEDARGKARVIVKEAEITMKAAEASRASAAADQHAAASARSSAEADQQTAAQLRAQWEAKAGALRNAIGA